MSFFDDLKLDIHIEVLLVHLNTSRDDMKPGEFVIEFLFWDLLYSFWYIYICSNG